MFKGQTARELKETSEKLRAAEERIQALQRDLQVSKSRLIRTEEEAHQDAEAHERELQAMASAHTTLRATLREEEIKVEELQNDKKMLVVSAEEHGSQYLHAKERITVLERELNEALSVKASRISKLEQQLKDAASCKPDRVAELETQLRDANSAHQERVQALEARLADLGSCDSDRATSLESQLNDAVSNSSKRIASLEQELIDVATAKAQRIAELEKQLDDTVSISSKSISTLESQLDQAIAVNTERIALMQKQLDEVTSAKSERDQLRNELEHANDRIISLKAELATHPIIDRLFVELDHAHAQITSLQAKLDGDVVARQSDSSADGDHSMLALRNGSSHGYGTRSDSVDSHVPAGMASDVSARLRGLRSRLLSVNEDWQQAEQIQFLLQHDCDTYRAESPTLTQASHDHATTDIAHDSMSSVSDHGRRAPPRRSMTEPPRRTIPRRISCPLTPTPPTAVREPPRPKTERSSRHINASPNGHGSANGSTKLSRSLSNSRAPMPIRNLTYDGLAFQS